MSIFNSEIVSTVERLEWSSDDKSHRDNRSTAERSHVKILLHGSNIIKGTKPPPETHLPSLFHLDLIAHTVATIQVCQPEPASEWVYLRATSSARESTVREPLLVSAFDNIIFREWHTRNHNSRCQDVCGNADRWRLPGLSPEDAAKVRVHLQVLPAALHKVIQPHDPRADAQESRGHLLVRDLRQIL